MGIELDRQTENSVHPNDIREKRRNENQKECDCHHERGWRALFKTSRPPGKPNECPADWVKEEEAVSQAY